MPPRFRGLVAGPLLHEDASHGLTVVLGSLLALVGAAHNSLDHYRRMVTSAGFSPTLHRSTGAAHEASQSTPRWHRVAQGSMDRERLQRGVIRTAQDQQDVQAFRTPPRANRPAGPPAPDPRGTPTFIFG